MSRPALLDLFARAQGTSVGYARSGFRVTASDIDSYDCHPEVDKFFTANALDVLDDVNYCRQFDLITASPPCQFYTLAPVTNQSERPRLISIVREKLERIGKPFIIENVVSRKSRAEMVDPITLCGSMFGLGAVCRDGLHRQLRRHRYFDSDLPIVAPGPCQHKGQPGGVYGTGGGGQMTRGYKFHATIGVYGHGSNQKVAKRAASGTIGVYGKTGNGPASKGYSGDKAEAREAMGIDWMRRDDLSQAIPPAYTQWLGGEAMLLID